MKFMPSAALRIQHPTARLRAGRGGKGAGPANLSATPRHDSPSVPGSLTWWAVGLGALALAFVLGACEPSTPTDFEFQAAETTNRDFAPVEFVPAGNFPVTLALADIDGDSDPDVAVVNQFETPADASSPADSGAPGTITLLANDGAGGFTQTGELTAGTLPSLVLSGEFTGDGFADIALLTESATVVRIFLNDGAGGFSATDFPLSGTASRMALADLNGDGSAGQDLIVSVTDALEPLDPGLVVALVNDGAGAFTAVSSLIEGLEPLPAPSAFVIEDWNGDGDADLAVTELRQDTVVIMLGNGAGGFSIFGDAIPVGEFPFDLLVEDFSGDGRKDIIVTTRSDGRLWLLEGGGGGTFGVSPLSPIELADGTGAPERLLLGDFTPDGKDLVIVQRTGSAISMLDWNNSGNFGLHVLPLSRDPFAAVQGDFDRDGDADLLTAEEEFRLLSVNAAVGNGTFVRTVIGLDTNTVTPTVADLDGDGGPDLLFLQPNADRMGVLLNCHPAPATACP
jgi:hypothetical protein